MKILFLLLLSIFDSGNSSPNLTGRIVGGVENAAGQIPWAVSIRTLQGEHFCTGSVVNNWWIITAAHCLTNRTPASIGLLLGRVTQDGSGGIQRQGFRIVSHPSYDPITMNFDLGLIQTSVIITFSTTVQSIFLANTFSGGNVNAKVSGWGATSPEMGPTSNNLKTLDVVTYTNAACRENALPWSAERITENMICTSTEGGVGWCGTDAGGSLVWNSQLIGVASWNIPCAQGYPDVYVRISQLRNWILSIIGTN